MGAPPVGSKTGARWGGRLRLVEPGEGFSESHEYPEDYEYLNGFDGDGELQAPAAFEGITVAEEIGRAGRALLDLVLEDPDAWGVYEKQCGEGLIGMATRARLLRLALEGRGEMHGQEAVEVAIPEMALDTHPESPAAAWEKLHSLDRIRQEHVVSVRDGAVPAVVDAAVKEERLFKAMTHLALGADGPSEEGLLAVSREAYTALRRRSLRFSPRGFSGHVWEAIGDVFPDAPGVRWDGAWADDLAKRAVAHVAARVPAYAGGGASEELDRAHDEVVAAAEAEDRCRYRRALREWVAAASRAADSGSSPLA